MGEKIVVGPINKGLRNDRTAFVIDNDSFPTLINAYQWRGRVKRKRGTQFLGRLTRFFSSTISSYSSVSTITLNGSGAGNLLTGFSLQSDGNIVPGSVTITIGGNVYTDPNQNGTLTGPNPGTINYATGAIVIPAEAGNNASAIFRYTPDLPVMGLEEFTIPSNAFPATIAFDTVYSYNINTAFPYGINDVSFYKNLSTATYVGYVQKTNWTPTTWNGQDYQQFWTVNYQGALWATNGINVPFSVTNIGMQYNTIIAVGGIVAGPPAFATITTATNHGLVIGDFVFINEIEGMTGINFQTGYVTATPAANQITVEFPNATIGGAWASGGIVQYLTNRSDVTKDGIRWYDGDPTNGGTTPVFVTGNGWVNFAPPLSQGDFSIADLPADQYYLVGARVIVPFKDRLLFFGPVIQTSAAGSQVYLQDTIIYSQNGTPYYTASYTNTPSATVDTPASASNVFHPILVPVHQTATSPAYFEDQTGFGGFISAGVDKPIITVSINEDVLIVGFNPNLQTRVVYSGNDIIPFNFFFINSELGSSSTFSAVNLDKGVITRGPRGLIITSQVEALRIDMEIPDQVFQMKLTDNGNERMCSNRDFINEWAYFTYPSDIHENKFPNQTLQYNYRDNSWAIFNECYTTYGPFNKQTGFTWTTVGDIYESWSEWTDSWDAGESELLQPDVIGGNQQGFVLIMSEGVGEGKSLYIQSFSGNVVTSPDHCLNNGDYIIITGTIGDIGSQVDGKIFSIFNVTTDTFELSPQITSGSYSGGGVITRIYIPYIQTKQFPVAWGMSRKTRLGPQQYLLTTTNESQITLLIFLSENGTNAYNEGPIIPDTSSVNNSLIYSTVLYTCPESTNLGLTPSNVNLQMPTGSQQSQIWHRVNTSLIGDTVQVGFTMSDAQIRDLDVTGTAFDITGATQANPCVLTCSGQFASGQLILIEDVEGMTELNGNIYQVISSTTTEVTIDVNSSGFTTYTDGGTATPVEGINAFAEIELHGFILDVQPSQVLA